MKTLLKIGLAAVALLVSIGAFAVRAGNNTPTLYAVTDLGPGSVFKASNPDASGTFLVVGSTPDPDVNVRATVWTVRTDGTVDSVFMYDKSLGASQAIDVNDHGMIVGSWEHGAFVNVPGVGLEFLPGATNPTGVNNHGVVVGYGSVATAPGTSGIVWYVDATTGAVTGPVYTTIGPGVTFLPFDINDEGKMSGFILTAGSPDYTAATAEFDSDGQLQVQNLGVLNPGDTGAIGQSINSDGLVAGGSFGTTLSAFLWDPTESNTLTSLGDLGGGQSSAFDINEDGLVVGWSITNAKLTVGFIWHNGNMVNLNKVLTSRRNDSVEFAYGINNTGHIVGRLESGNACVLTPQ